MKRELEESFRQELQVQLDALQAGLLDLEERADPERLDSAFRVAHNLKSATALLGLEQASETLHRLEGVLEELRDGPRAVDTTTVSGLLAQVDALRHLLAAPVHAAPGRAAEAPPRRVHISLRPAATALAEGFDPLAALEALAELGTLLAIRTDERHVPPLSRLAPERLYLSFTAELETRAHPEELRAPFLFAGESQVEITEVAPSATEGRGAKGADAATLPVAARRIDTLVELSSELQVMTSSLEELAGVGGERLRAVVAQVRALTARLHETAVATRLVPLGPTFELLRRFVRDQAVLAGKDVEVVILGRGTELDRAVADRLLDPLKHLVRNALDHGLEPAAERVRLGKPARGRLVLEAQQAQGRMLLRVSDDGRGLEPERLHRQAVARGLVPPSRELSEAELQALIFLPGFSTAEGAAALSGRGVGLDAARRAIQELGGELRVHSRPGEGTTFEANVRLTLAMIDGLIVQCGGERAVIPLELVRGLTRPRREQVSVLPGGAEILLLPEGIIPLARPARLWAPAAPPDVPLLIVQVSLPSGPLALAVDDVLGQGPILLKELTPSLRLGPGVLAAAVMGDGRVAMVLDVAALALEARDLDPVLNPASRPAIRP